MTSDPTPPTRLDSRQRAFLRKLGQPEKPVLMVGKEGLTDEVTAALARLLDQRELVKIRWLKTCPLEASEIQERLAAATGATPVGRIGRSLLLYRRSPTEPRIVLPRSP